jgi:hypothetical protein
MDLFRILSEKSRTNHAAVKPTHSTTVSKKGGRLKLNQVSIENGDRRGSLSRYESG